MIRQIAETGKTVPLCDVIRRLVENGAFENPEREAARAMSEAPHAPEPHNLMGIILENENDHIGAMKHFRAAWALDPTYLPARFNMEQYGRFSAVERVDAYDESDCTVEDEHHTETAKWHAGTVA